MPMLRHPDITALGGPVPDEAVDFWRTKGFEPVSEEEATAYQAAQAAADLDSMTKDELVAEAGRRGVDVTASDRKADIIAAIRAAG